MTLRSTALLLFPGLILVLALAGFLGGAWVGGALGAALGAGWVLSTIYLLPVLCYRLHNALWPVEPGGSYLIGKSYSPWWGGHQLQLIYLAAPWLEGLLRLVPGLYSAWLRLWGSTVGRSVYWTPQVEIGDRGLMIIGDQVIFGHRAVAFAHVIKPRRDNLLLLVKPITIGSGAFIGAGAVLGPGVEVEPGAFVEAGAHLHPNAKVRPKQKGPKVEA